MENKRDKIRYRYEFTLDELQSLREALEYLPKSEGREVIEDILKYARGK